MLAVASAAKVPMNGTVMVTGLMTGGQKMPCPLTTLHGHGPRRRLPCAPGKLFPHSKMSAETCSRSPGQLFLQCACMNSAAVRLCSAVTLVLASIYGLSRRYAVEPSAQRAFLASDLAMHSYPAGALDHVSWLRSLDF